MNTMRKVALWGILFLFLLQLITLFFESVYAFGLLVVRFTPETASIMLVFAPLLLLFFRKPPARPVMLGLVLAALACRAAVPLLPLNGRLVVSGIGMASLFIFLTSVLARRESIAAVPAGPSLVLALLLSVFFRALGSGIDWSVTRPAVGLGLAIIAAWLILVTDLGSEEPRQSPSISLPRLAGLAIGIAGVFLMLYFALGAPAVMARWTGYRYRIIVIVLTASQACFAWAMGTRLVSRLLRKGTVLVWNLLFVLAMVAAILPHQISFPTDPASYPVAAAASSPLALIPLLAMLILSPVVVVDLVVLSRAAANGRPTVRQLGGAFGIASLFLMVMVFLNVFTTVYDYAPVVGPPFRDRFWLVYLLAGLGLALPLLLVRGESWTMRPFEAPRPLFAGLALAAILSIVAAMLTAAHPSGPGASGELTYMSYNIQQGFDARGDKNPERVLASIRRVDPDLLGLVESDTARISGGNDDVVRFLANGLHMYNYYGPKTVTGTFGIALLSKYPIEEPRTFFMYSAGEQTAAIHAKINAGGRTWNVVVTHLGNDGPMVQLQNLLKGIGDEAPLIAAGDFNFQPSTDQYRLITASLADSWLLRWPGGQHRPGADLAERIDYIFVTPGTAVLESEYVVDGLSDHPSHYTVIRP
ncbi:MAG: endonuclease/exonuclease/phosphatase family protein [Spirochaetes bacterium]|nr:endonuclease/exonuclease/phosphatase family protein [Spirochaetota bacterium]